MKERSVYEVYATSSPDADRTVVESRIALATSMETAEEIIGLDVNDRSGLEPVHSYRIARMPVDIRVGDWSVIEEYLYDGCGQFLDKRERDDDRHYCFMGRDESACRLRPGDICEALVGGKLLPGIVAALPPNPEAAAKVLSANGGLFGLDYPGDDAYIILVKDTDGKFTNIQIDTLRVFAPGRKPHPSAVRSFSKALAEYRTAPVRLAIRAVSAKERLQSVLDELEIEGAITTPVFPQECLALDLSAESLPNLGGEITIVIPLRKVEKHLDMVRGGLARLAGKPVSGRGYHLKDSTPKDQWYGLTDKPLHSF